MLTARLALTKNYLVKHAKLRPKVAVVLGSGLGGLVDAIESEAALPYKDIPNFPVTSVAGHKGRLIFGHTGNQTPVLIFDGRLHFYEGLTMQQVAYPVYVAQALGALVFIATNAAGGINDQFSPGDLMLIRDHLNLTGDNPLRGPNATQLGARFPSMHDAYDPELFALALNKAQEAGIPLRQGVYAAMSGPTYETDAELRMLRLLGADAVGMSTVPEVIAARHAGLRVMGLSVIANNAAPNRTPPLEDVDHENVVRIVERTVPNVRTILEGVIEGINF